MVVDYLQQPTLKKEHQLSNILVIKLQKKKEIEEQTYKFKKQNDTKKKGMVYVFELNKKYDIDGSVKENHAKLINHSCGPNCEVEIVNNHIWISAIKNIKKNQELYYNYGYSFDTDYIDHICKCGSFKCIGYILDEDEWPKLKKK